MSSSRPRDGPSTSFEADAKVSALFSKEDYIGLVIVVGWRLDSQIIDPPYSSLLEAVQQCFDDSDFGDTPNVYLYPSKYLHVTVATLYPTVRKTEDNMEYSKLNADYTALVHAASKRAEWPSTPLKLKIDSTQLGSKAGILLWEETTGGIRQMRVCLEEEAKLRNMTIHSVPPIVHTTYLRFKDVPNSNGVDTQERFQSLVVPRIREFFRDEIKVDTAKLVYETTPYMHVPDDTEHVFASISLLKP